MAKNRFISMIILVIAVAFIGYLVVDNLDNNKVGLSNGMIAPDFTLQLWGTDEKVALSSYRGEIVVLNLWASWCPPCRDEMPDLNKFHNDFKDKGVTVLGINMFKTEANQAVVDDFMVEFEITFPNVIDESISVTNQRGLVQSKYDATTIPRTYIIDQEGRIFNFHNGSISYEVIKELVEKLKEAQ